MSKKPRHDFGLLSGENGRKKCRDPDVVQATQVAQGHAARLVDLVVADAKVIRRCGTNGWPIFRVDSVR